MEAAETRLLLSRLTASLHREPPAEVRSVASNPAPERPALHGLADADGRQRPPVERHGRPVGRGLHARPATARWSWLAGTYWCVPPANLPSILYSPTRGVILPQADQTVFQITGYRNGYFWGISVTQLGSSSPTSSTMIGSVTPEGAVLLNFSIAEGSSGPSITQGIGQMRLKHGRWTMENQMFTSPSDRLQVGHWAYMVRTRPGLASWDSLPGVGVSVPEFLGANAIPSPRPVGG